MRSVEPLLSGQQGWIQKIQKVRAGTPLSYMDAMYLTENSLKMIQMFAKSVGALVAAFLNLVIKQFEFMKRQWSVIFL